MGLSDTPNGERLQIAFFGRTNVGKSSLINAITGQNLSVVSNVKGTTTDPVYKAMELLPLGPVLLVDTPGFNDEGTLGGLRIEKAKEVLRKTDAAILVMDAREGYTWEEAIIEELKERKISYFIVWNKADLYDNAVKKMAIEIAKKLSCDYVQVSAEEKIGIQELKEKIAGMFPESESTSIVSDLLQEGETALLVMPIDKAAPKKRLILPQQQTIRDLLDYGRIAVITEEVHLLDTLDKLKEPPKLVITDSQIFGEVASKLGPEISLTSFSILFARYKGELESLISGIKAVKELKDNDIVLMAEGCTHHRQCGDIGTIKIPAWLENKTGKKLVFETSSGSGFPKDLSQYALIVHCGACMLNKKEMGYRLEEAKRQQIPIVNYGILIAYLKGILERSLQPFSIGEKEEKDV